MYLSTTIILALVIIHISFILYNRIKFKKRKYNLIDYCIDVISIAFGIWKDRGINNALTFLLVFFVAIPSAILIGYLVWKSLYLLKPLFVKKKPKIITISK